MGVKGLLKMIAESAPRSMEDVNERTLFTQGDVGSMAVDTTYVIHRFVHADPCRHDLAADLVRKFAPLVANAPASVFVFDGEPRGEKASAKATRQQRRASESAQLAAARELLRGDPLDEDAARLQRLVESLERRCADPTDDVIESVRARFVQEGWNVEVALHDGEERVAELVRSGRCDAAYTDDSDALVWGAPVTLIRAGKARQMVRVHLDRVLEELQLTSAQFTDMAILLGTDFTATTLPGIGPKRALSLIREHGSIEGILDAHPAKQARVDTGEFDFIAARSVFAH